MTDFWFLNAPEAAGASDWHLTPGQPLRLRIDGVIRQIDGAASRRLITDNDVAALSVSAPLNDDEFTLPDGRRFRVHRLQASKLVCAVVRAVPAVPPTIETIDGLPAGFRHLLDRQEGLILVGGATGSGKSTTMAASLDYLNKKGGIVIRTLEDPIEYRHTPADNTAIYQAAFDRDFTDWPAAIASAMRDDPDVIYIGEMRDAATITAALRAAETGHLVFATVHGGSPAAMIDRIISACPKDSRDAIAALIANLCIGLLAQKLVPAAKGGRLALFELLVMTTATAQTIRQNHLHQVRAAIVTGRQDGMVTFDQHIESLRAARKITVAVAREYHSKPDSLSQ